MEAPLRPVVIGELIGAHGVRGAFRMRSWCEPPERIFRYRPIWLRRGAQLLPLQVRSRKPLKDGYAVEVEGVDTREGTVPWIGAEVVVDRSTLPPPAPGEYYWADLLGLAVHTTEGVDLGVVDRLFNTGANDVMAVQGADRERLIPFVTGSHVQSVDLDARRIVVDWDPDF